MLSRVAPMRAGFATTSGRSTALRPCIRDHSYTSGDLTTLLRHDGEFLAYEDGRYIVKEDETLEAELYPFLERAHYMSDGVPIPYRPKRAKVSNVVHALQATVHVPSEKLQPPSWLKERDLAPDELVVCQNGILH